MRIGKYSTKKIDFVSFSTFRFVPFLFDPVLYGDLPCGVTMLSLLTGHNPFIIKWTNKCKNHCSDKFVVNYLKKYGFKILELTHAKVSHNYSNILENKIKHYHVIVLSQLVKKGEATWCVLNNGSLYHNFNIIKINELEFLNRPINTAYLINHSIYAKKSNKCSKVIL